MQAKDVLGMPLEAALEALRLSGAGDMQVVITRAPRDTRSDGTLRVVRVRGNELTAAYFHDGEPAQHSEDKQ